MFRSEKVCLRQSDRNMDVEAAKDDLSVEDGNLIVFTEVQCSVPRGIQGKHFYNTQSDFS